MVISNTVITSSWSGVATPRTTPKLMRTAAAAKSADSIVPRSIPMKGHPPSVWCTWKKPYTRVNTSMATAERSMLRETAERPYLFRNVIRKPKPMKIITWTSWNIAYVATFCFFFASATAWKSPPTILLLLTDDLGSYLTKTKKRTMTMIWMRRKAMTWLLAPTFAILLLRLNFSLVEVNQAIK